MNLTFAGKRCVVIGAAGFIGSHLTRALAERGADVVGVVRSQTEVATDGPVGFVAADATSVQSLKQIIRPSDTIFMLAGRAGAAASVADPAGDLAANCGSLLAVLQAAVLVEPRPRIVFTGSRLQYGRVATLPVGESHPLHPTSPYGLHKTFCEHYLHYYRHQHGISYAIARLTNPFGSGTQAAKRSYNVLNQIIDAALRQETIPIYGDGAQIRDYVYIDDVVDGLMLLALHGDDCTVNIGSGVGIPFVEAVKTITSLCGGSIRSVPWPPEALAVETGDFVASIDRARSLGFLPATSFTEGIARSVAAMTA
jgi:UDP-glucose 4-epimerase